MVKVVKTSEYQLANSKKYNALGSEKQVLWLHFVSPKLQKMLINMNETEATIIKWSKKRVLYCGVFALFGLSFLALKPFGSWGPKIGLGLIAFSLIYYFVHGRSIVSQFKEYNFLQQVEFSKFTRIIIPYLLNDNHYSLFSAMKKVDQRLEVMAKPIMTDEQRNKEKKKLVKNKNQTTNYTRQEWMRRISIQFDIGEKEAKVMEQSHLNLKKLMVRMRDDSTDIEPYIDFAEYSSGSQEARTFMESLFYYSQASSDVSVIKELSSMSNKQLFIVVDEVIKQKIKVIAGTPMIITVLVVLPLFGVLGSYVVHMFMTVMSQL